MSQRRRSNSNTQSTASAASVTAVAAAAAATAAAAPFSVHHHHFCRNMQIQLFPTSQRARRKGQVIGSSIVLEPSATGPPRGCPGGPWSANTTYGSYSRSTTLSCLALSSSSPPSPLPLSSMHGHLSYEQEVQAKSVHTPTTTTSAGQPTWAYRLLYFHCTALVQCAALALSERACVRCYSPSCKTDNALDFRPHSPRSRRSRRRGLGRRCSGSGRGDRASGTRSAPCDRSSEGTLRQKGGREILKNTRKKNLYCVVHVQKWTQNAFLRRGVQFVRYERAREKMVLGERESQIRGRPRRRSEESRSCGTKNKSGSGTQSCCSGRRLRLRGSYIW